MADPAGAAAAEAAADQPAAAAAAAEAAAEEARLVLVQAITMAAARNPDDPTHALVLSGLAKEPKMSVHSLKLVFNLLLQPKPVGEGAGQRARAGMELGALLLADDKTATQRSVMDQINSSIGTAAIMYVARGFADVIHGVLHGPPSATVGVAPQTVELVKLLQNSDAEVNAVLGSLFTKYEVVGDRVYFHELQHACPALYPLLFKTLLPLVVVWRTFATTQANSPGRRGSVNPAFLKYMVNHLRIPGAREVVLSLKQLDTPLWVERRVLAAEYFRALWPTEASRMPSDDGPQSPAAERGRSETTTPTRKAHRSESRGQGSSRPRSPPRCGKCDSPAHMRRDCPERQK